MARLLDVSYHMLLEEAQHRYHLRWSAVTSIIGNQDVFLARYPEANPANIGEFLLFSDDNQNSVASCIRRVRENARAIRDRISREMWEHVNALYHRMAAYHDDQQGEIHGLCREILTASHTFNGIVDSTLPHDEGWQFIRAGRALERAEHTARVLDVEYHGLLETQVTENNARYYQWRAVLRSVGALEMYGRAYHSIIEPEKVCELLILHKHHPRSLRFNVASLQSALRAISGATVHSYLNEAERLTGKLHDALVYSTIQEIFERGLHEFLRDVGGTSRQIGDQIAGTYFHYAGAAS
jgi:uncharacterized alpha-E superfamily protein